MPLLEVKNLRTSFHTRNGTFRAVDDVSFSIEKGEILGLVGESGSGKSVTCLSLLGLLPTPPAKIESGSARFGDRDLLRASDSELRAIRGARIAMIFQDPMTALNPFLRMRDQLVEPLMIHGRASPAKASARAGDMLASVGINDPGRRLGQYPHELSGGMRQRVMIAMALITGPELLIADEPTTALDVTVQAQILAVLREQQARTGMSILYITHDLGVVAGLCHRVQVMYAGRIVESAPVKELYKYPAHPYTQGLLRSIPSTQERGVPLHGIAGLPPDTSRLVPGCAFADRCEQVVERCRTGGPPPLIQHSAGHADACLREDLPR